MDPLCDVAFLALDNLRSGGVVLPLCTGVFACVRPAGKIRGTTRCSKPAGRTMTDSFVKVHIRPSEQRRASGLSTGLIKFESEALIHP